MLATPCVPAGSSFVPPTKPLRAPIAAAVFRPVRISPRVIGPRMYEIACRGCGEGTGLSGALRELDSPGASLGAARRTLPTALRAALCEVAPTTLAADVQLAGCLFQAFGCKNARRLARRLQTLSLASEVVRLESGVLGNSRKHLGADVFSVVEGKHVALPSLTLENLVRALLASDGPANTHQRRQDDAGPRRPPVTHRSLRCE